MIAVQLYTIRTMLQDPSRLGGILGDDGQHAGMQAHLGLVDGDECRRFGAGEDREQEEEPQRPIG